jgi:hypothetical protein
MSEIKNLFKDSARFKKFVRNAITYFLVILFSLVLLEILMVVLEPYIFKGFYQYDRDLGFKVRPYTNGTNRFGFNARDYSLNKAEGVFRILIVGDSFSWAGGKDGNYSALLEKKFEKYYGRHRVDIINTGYPMTHTGEQLAMLKKYGLQYHPDMVFLGFFAGNDFLNADPYRKRIVVNDTNFDIDTRHEKIFWGYPVILQSRLWHFIKQKMFVFRKINTDDAQQTEWRQEDKNNTACMFSEEDFLYIEKGRLEFCNMSSHDRGTYKKNVDYIFQSLYQMQQLLTDRKIKFVVGIYPDEFQVSNAILLQIFESFGLEKSKYDVELMQHILKEYLESEHVPYIDVLDSFKAKGTKEPLYLCRNTHWNRAGNELAASIIFQYLLPQVDSMMKQEK